RMGHDSARAAMIYQHATSKADHKIAAVLAEQIETSRGKSPADTGLEVIRRHRIRKYGLRGAALAFPSVQVDTQKHDNGCRPDRNRCRPGARLLLRPVAALRGEPEVSEDAGRWCGEGCMEGTQEPAADRCCHRGLDLPVDPRPGALTLTCPLTGVQRQQHGAPRPRAWRQSSDAAWRASQPS